MTPTPKTARGSAFLLKVGDGGSPQVYRTVAGLRATAMAISGEAVPLQGAQTGWLELAPGEGARSVSIHAAGIFLGSAAESQVRTSALSGTLDDYQLSFEGGERMTGKFLILRLDYSGDFNGERNYVIHLESSGEVTLS